MINLHCHTLTYGMFGNHPHWGPTWENGTMKIGNWHLGTKKDRPLEPLMETLSHQGCRRRRSKAGSGRGALSRPVQWNFNVRGGSGTGFGGTVNTDVWASCPA